MSAKLENLEPMKQGGSLRQQEGLTLLEFLIGLALFSFLLTIMTQASRDVLFSWEQSGVKIERENSFWSGINIIHRQIVSAMPYRPGGGTGREIAFAGSPNSVTFVSSHSAGSRGRPGLWFIRYTLEPSERSGESKLLLRQWPALKESWWLQDEVPVDSTALLQGLKAGRFFFRSFDPLQNKWEAYDFWPFAGSGKLPHAICLEGLNDKQEFILEFPLACSES